MDGLSDADLRQRAKDIFINLLVLTNESKIGMPPITPQTEMWLIRWTEILEEFKSRFGPYPAGFTDGFIREVDIPRPDVPLAEQAAATIRNHFFAAGTSLVKYGKERHMTAMVEKGSVRISPASFYHDASLNSAIHDDELELSGQLYHQSLVLQVFDWKTGELKSTIRPSAPITFRRKSETDYFVYCLSSVFVPRLFLDFKGDACVVITDPQKLLDKIARAVDAEIPNWIRLGGMVTYVDPLNTSPSFNLFLAKHLRYAYQKEFRVVWLPSAPRWDLKPIDLRLGSLSDCCQLITLHPA